MSAVREKVSSATPKAKKTLLTAVKNLLNAF